MAYNYIIEVQNHFPFYRLCETKKKNVVKK